MHVTLSEMRRAAHEIAAGSDVAHGEAFVIDQPVAGIEPAVDVDAQIGGAGAARIGPVAAAMDLVQRGLEIAERIALARQNRALGLGAAIDHVVAEAVEIGGREAEPRIGRHQDRAEPDRVEAERHQMIEDRQQRPAGGRHGGARRQMARPAEAIKSLQGGQDPVIGAAAAVERPLRVVERLRPVDADRDLEVVIGEQAHVVVGEQRRIGGDGKPHRAAAAACLRARIGNDLAHQCAVQKSSGIMRARPPNLPSSA